MSLLISINLQRIQHWTNQMEKMEEISVWIEPTKAINTGNANKKDDVGTCRCQFINTNKNKKVLKL